MSVCLRNAHSLINKLSNFQSFIYSHSLNIVAITESWLSDYILNNEILPSGYSIYRHNRPLRGGGVMLAVNNTLPSKILPSPYNLELVAVKIYSKYSFILCLIYNPPNSDLSYFFNLLDYLNNLLALNNKIILLGDFNLPDINCMGITNWTIRIFISFL